MNQKSSVLQPGKSAYMASPPVTGKRIRSGDALLSFTPRAGDVPVIVEIDGAALLASSL